MTDCAASLAQPKKRPRLLILASTYPRWAGDPEPGFVHELAKRLTNRFAVTVLCPHAEGALVRETLDGVAVIRYRYAPVRWEKLVNDGGIVTNLRRHPWMLLLLPSFILSQWFWLWHLGHRRHHDVIHAHWLIPQGFLIAVLQAIGRNMAPFMVTSHGADLFALRGRLFAATKRFVLRRAKKATVVSAAMKKAIAELGVEPEKISIEPMGVDLQTRFFPDPAVPRDPNTLLFVGRLVEKKGLQYLLQAMPHALAQRPGVQLKIAGFGPELAARQQQVAALGLSAHVQFLGAVPQAELPALYRRASIFVAPFVEAASGDQEGLGLVVVEALGCGCPVVISDLPATREFGEIPGLQRVPPADPAALATALLARLAQSEETTPWQAPALMRFDWQARAERYAYLLGRLT